MKKLIFILIASGLFSLAAQAQIKSTFDNGIFKPPEAVETTKPEITLSDFKYQKQANGSSILNVTRANPGAAFAASAIVPGLGQAVNGKWIRAGIYFATEVVGVVYHLDRNATARRQEKAYEEFTHENWSVVAYAQWIVEYSDANGLSQPQLDELRNMVYSNGRPIAPSWGNTPQDWSQVNIATLHAVENRTPFIFEDKYGSEFSHALPQYGSQQYYELISKYYQYQSGWQDFYNVVINSDHRNYDPNHPFFYGWDGKDQPNTMFFEGRDRAQEFNDNYRAAGNILKLLLVNHVVSAFDALFTVQLKNSRIESNTNLMRMDQFSFTWHF